MGHESVRAADVVKLRRRRVLAASFAGVLALLAWWQIDEDSLRRLAFQPGTGITESAVEDLQTLVLLAAIATAIALGRSVPSRKFGYWSVALVLIFVLGEEVSWGQHYFGWAAPEGWTAINSQNETTLHNLEPFQERFWFLGRFNTLFVVPAVGSIVLAIAWVVVPRRLAWLVPDWSVAPLFLTCAAIHWGTALAQSRWGLPGNATLTVADWEIGELLLYLGLLGWLQNHRLESVPAPPDRPASPR